MVQSNAASVRRFGQSFWYDNISRSILDSGRLAAMVTDDGIAGVTSNPTIFMKAVEEGAEYDADIRLLAGQGRSVEETVLRLTADDIRRAADILRPVWNASGGDDGYVSLECDPHLAHDHPGTVREAARLRGEVDRPNLMIKVPGTARGALAVRELIAGGTNVNVTLLFSPDQYRRVAEAYLEGLEDRLARGLPLAEVRSVASFFLSRIDTVIDRLLDDRIRNHPDEGRRRQAAALRGEAAIAVAKVTYGIFGELFGSERFRRLREAGGRIQRPLWASTGTKDPAYSDVKYVEGLVGPHTVNTLPQATLDAFRDHGRAEETLTRGLAESGATLASLEGLGIALDPVYRTLQEDGVRAFIESWESLLATVRRKMGRPA
jgi:transaldolase